MIRVFSKWDMVKIYCFWALKFWYCVVWRSVVSLMTSNSYYDSRGHNSWSIDKPMWTTQFTLIPNTNKKTIRFYKLNKCIKVHSPLENHTWAFSLQTIYKTTRAIQIRNHNKNLKLSIPISIFWKMGSKWPKT